MSLFFALWVELDKIAITPYFVPLLFALGVERKRRFERLFKMTIKVKMQRGRAFKDITRIKFL